MHLSLVLSFLVTLGAVRGNPAAEAQQDARDISGPNPDPQYALGYGINPYSAVSNLTPIQTTNLAATVYNSDLATQQNQLLNQLREQQLINYYLSGTTASTPQLYTIPGTATVHNTAAAYNPYAVLNANRQLMAPQAFNNQVYTNTAATNLNERQLYNINGQLVYLTLAELTLIQQQQASRGKREADPEAETEAHYSAYGYDSVYPSTYTSYKPAAVYSPYYTRPVAPKRLAYAYNYNYAPKPASYGRSYYREVRPFIAY